MTNSFTTGAGADAPRPTTLEEALEILGLVNAIAPSAIGLVKSLLAGMGGKSLDEILSEEGAGWADIRAKAKAEIARASVTENQPSKVVSMSTGAAPGSIADTVNAEPVTGTPVVETATGPQLCSDCGRYFNGSACACAASSNPVSPVAEEGAPQ